MADVMKVPFDPFTPEDAIVFLEQFLLQESEVLKLELKKVGELYQGEATLRLGE